MKLDDMLQNSAEAVKLLKAVSNERRLIILCHLLEGEMSVGEINERLDLSQSALSQHLALLRKQELVTTRKASQTVYYRIESDEVKAIISLLHQLYCTE